MIFFFVTYERFKTSLFALPKNVVVFFFVEKHILCNIYSSGKTNASMLKKKLKTTDTEHRIVKASKQQHNEQKDSPIVMSNRHVGPNNHIIICDIN